MIYHPDHCTCEQCKREQVYLSLNDATRKLSYSAIERLNAMWDEALRQMDTSPVTPHTPDSSPPATPRDS